MQRRLRRAAAADPSAGRPRSGLRRLRRPRRGIRRDRPATPSADRPAALAGPPHVPRVRRRPAAGSAASPPATAFVAVIAALILGAGVSAAVTGGRSVNPLAGLQQVVAELTGGRTAEQSDLFEQAQSDLDAATGAVDRGDRAEARAHLRDYDRLDLGVLTRADQDRLAAHRAQVQQRLR